MTREIDTRMIPGHGGKVVWLWNETASEHAVIVFGPDGVQTATVSNLTGAQAHDAFHHTFAHPRVPNVFSNKAVPV